MRFRNLQRHYHLKETNLLRRLVQYDENDADESEDHKGNNDWWSLVEKKKKKKSKVNSKNTKIR